MNGSLNLFIPLLSVPQRGGYAMTLGVVHHSNEHTLSQHTNVSSTLDTTDGTNLIIDTITYQESMPSYDSPLEFNLPRLQFSSEYVGDYSYYVGTAFYYGNVYCYTNFAFTDWQGNRHPFENVSTCNYHLGGPNAPMVNVTDSSDGSFYRLDTTDQADLKVYSEDGTVYHFYGFSNNPPSNNLENYYDTRSGLIVDPNGNQIGVQSSYSNNVTTYTVTDTLGRTFTLSPAGVSYKDSSGENQAISIVTTASSSMTSHDFGLTCHYAGTIQHSPYVTPTVASVLGNYTNLPTSTTSVITFPASAGGGAKEYTLTFDEIDRLTKVQYPFGGYTRYDYATGQQGSQTMGSVQCAIGNVGQVWHKYECSASSGSPCTEQTTTYQPTIFSGTGTFYNSSTTITDPLGNQTIYEYSPNAARTSPQETDIKTNDSAGKPLMAVHNSYPTITPSSTGPYSFDYDFPTQVTTTYYGGSSPITTSVAYTYESYSALPNYQSGIIDNPTEIDTTDYNGTTIEKVSQQWEPSSAFTSSPLILDRLQSRTTTDAVGTTSSTVSYGYDTAGNATSKTVSGTNAGPFTVQYSRNSYGEVKSITDARNLTTNVGYGDNWSSTSQTCVAANSSAYPTTVTNALGQTVSYSYNACTGTISSIKDPNGVTTAFSYDALGRILCTTVTDANSVVAAKTCDSYTDSAPSYLQEALSQSSSQSVVSTTTFDGFGRVLRTALNSDPNGEDLTDTTYDPLGRIQSVSNPYRTTSDSTYGITAYAYDALGRRTYECHPDNGTGPSSCGVGSDYLSWNYAGNIVITRDENGNQRQEAHDALGRLTQVLEPNGNSQAPSMETDYKYDAIGDVISATQCGDTCPSSTSRSRSFEYNGIGQLITATNPENGTICYGQWNNSKCVNGYDADGNVQYKTDARGITVNYSYDSLNRLLSKSYANDSNGTPTSCYQYDSGAVTNGIGRVSNEWTQSSGNCGSSPPATGTYTKQSILAYDALGRIVSEQQCTPSTCGSVPAYELAYHYDLAGDQTSYSNGLSNIGGEITFLGTYDEGGRLATLSSSYNDCLFAAQTTATTSSTCTKTTSQSPYMPWGALQNAFFGSGLSLSQSYDNRLRNTGGIYNGALTAGAASGSATVTITGQEQTQ